MLRAEMDTDYYCYDVHRCFRLPFFFPLTSVYYTQYRSQMKLGFIDSTSHRPKQMIDDAKDTFDVISYLLMLATLK